MSVATLLDTLADCHEGELTLRSPDLRGRIAATLASLARVPGRDLASRGTELAESAQAFRCILNRDQESLLDNPLQWTSEDRELAHWAANATWRWCAAAASAADASAGRDSAAALIGATLCMAGDSVKWHAIASMPCPNELMARASRALRVAEALGVSETEVVCEADGATLTRQAPHLYARALLLGYFTSGNLTRQQVEIADAWISRWSRDYALSRTAPASGTSMWVDVSKGHRLRAGDVAAAGDVRFLVLEALPRQLAIVERGFHGGRIFPGAGVSVKFRIEEHVAVLDHLHALVEQLRGTAPARREERKLVEGGTVEVFVGVREIAAGARLAGSAARHPSSTSATLQLVEEGARLRDAIDSLQEIELKRRWMGLADVSEGGIGLHAPLGDQEDIGVGDLVAISENGNLAVGEVMRRVPDGTAGLVIGVEIRTRSARPVRLQRIAGPDGRGVRQLDAVFLPGADACGRGDALVVTEGSYDPRARYELAIDECVFVIALNRVRRQGRGWLSCGFEVLDKEQRAA
ncbi:hypothetical protein DSM104443_01799 [Usitatibacter rugosus]|uniref:Uncharacterized protein n=1 Tax=Usitatibacter rugosus TaxID=2732067 RepID=A0A6M4GTT5_9PROT|nr:hypothetical protein [Usitatibacter rugosus]QJR10730.1 hypothetical protein DSM104443_01799 [Usitatibacter rugosus]